MLKWYFDIPWTEHDRHGVCQKLSWMDKRNLIFINPCNGSLVRCENESQYDKRNIGPLKYDAGELLSLRTRVYHIKELNTLPGDTLDKIRTHRIHKRRKRGKKKSCNRQIKCNQINRENLIPITCSPPSTYGNLIHVALTKTTEIKKKFRPTLLSLLNARDGATETVTTKMWFQILLRILRCI